MSNKHPVTQHLPIEYSSHQLLQKFLGELLETQDFSIEGVGEPQIMSSVFDARITNNNALICSTATTTG